MYHVICYELWWPHIDLTQSLFFTKVVGLSTSYHTVTRRLPFVVTIRGFRNLTGGRNGPSPARFWALPSLPGIGLKCVLNPGCSSQPSLVLCGRPALYEKPPQPHPGRWSAHPSGRWPRRAGGWRRSAGGDGEGRLHSRVHRGQKTLTSSRTCKCFSSCASVIDLIHSVHQWEKRNISFTVELHIKV